MSFFFFRNRGINKTNKLNYKFSSYILRDKPSQAGDKIGTITVPTQPKRAGTLPTQLKIKRIICITNKTRKQACELLKQLLVAWVNFAATSFYLSLSRRGGASPEQEAPTPTQGLPTIDQHLSPVLPFFFSSSPPVTLPLSLPPKP
jgi:hypothetical protein